MSRGSCIILCTCGIILLEEILYHLIVSYIYPIPISFRFWRGNGFPNVKQNKKPPPPKSTDRMHPFPTGTREQPGRAPLGDPSRRSVGSVASWTDRFSHWKVQAWQGHPFFLKSPVCGGENSEFYHVFKRVVRSIVIRNPYDPGMVYIYHYF